MIQPVRSRLNIQPTNNQQLSFKQTDSTVVQAAAQMSDSGKKDLLNYLEAKDKKDRNAQLISGVAGLALLGGTIFFMPKIINKSKNTFKKFNQEKDFLALANDNKIPTLDSCRSINDKLRNFLQTQVELSNATAEEIRQTGNPSGQNMLMLYGPPGTGKSYFAKIFAKTLKADYQEVKYSDLNKRYIGEHLEHMKDFFENIIKTAKANPEKKYVVTFNEIDSLVLPIEKISQGGTGHNAFKVEERSVFLNYLDDIQKQAQNVTIIGTTNVDPRNKGLDGAAMSRFKTKIQIPFPDRVCLSEALKAHINNMPDGAEFIKANEDKLNLLVQSMEKRHFSYRDLDNVVDDSKRRYLQDYMKNKDSKYKFEYLEKAIKDLDISDGEMAGK